MELENMILSKVIQAQKARNYMFPLNVSYRPKANAVILLNMDYILRAEHTRDKQGKERKPKI
jgi:hypothetical protein